MFLLNPLLNLCYLSVSCCIFLSFPSQVLHIRDLRKLIMTWSFVAYSYIGAEITYPISTFLMGQFSFHELTTIIKRFSKASLTNFWYHFMLSIQLSSYDQISFPRNKTIKAFKFFPELACARSPSCENTMPLS